MMTTKRNLSSTELTLVKLTEERISLRSYLNQIENLLDKVLIEYHTAHALERESKFHSMEAIRGEYEYICDLYNECDMNIKAIQSY